MTRHRLRAHARGGMVPLLRKGTKVQTCDWGAKQWGRPVEKREAIGVIKDHFRPYGHHSKDRTPPYLVRFPDGHEAWYDANEVARPKLARR